MGSLQLETVTDEQDLGVIISDGLKWEDNNNNSIYMYLPKWRDARKGKRPSKLTPLEAR